MARAEREHWLPGVISYRWDKRHGGEKAARDSPDTAWREDMLRGYAAHMRTDGYLATMDEVHAQADRPTVGFAEGLWRRCHRRLLANFVTAARGVPVRHLLHDGRLEEHRLSPGLRRHDDGLLVYDAGQPTLLYDGVSPGRRRIRWSARSRPATVMANASYPSRLSTQSRAADPMAKAAVA